MDNEDLKNLIREGKAEYIMHIESPASSYRIVQKTQSESVKITLLDEHLLEKFHYVHLLLQKKILKIISITTSMKIIVV